MTSVYFVELFVLNFDNLSLQHGLINDKGLVVFCFELMPSRPIQEGLKVLAFEKICLSCFRCGIKKFLSATLGIQEQGNYMA